MRTLPELLAELAAKPWWEYLVEAEQLQLSLAVRPPARPPSDRAAPPESVRRGCQRRHGTGLRPAQAKDGAQPVAVTGLHQLGAKVKVQVWPRGELA